MKYTYIKIEEWCGLWRGDELVSEGHDMSVGNLYDYTKQDGEFELVYYGYPDEGAHGDAFSHEHDFGGFADKTLAEWLPLCGEPG